MAHDFMAKPAVSHRRQAGSRPARACPALAAAFASVLFVGFLGMAIPAGATMYKWVDEKGQTIYSDQPPPPSIKSEIVKPPPPPANPNALKEMINAETEMKQREKQRVENAQKAEKARSDAEKRQQTCSLAQGQIKALEREDIY